MCFGLSWLGRQGLTPSALTRIDDLPRTQPHHSTLQGQLSEATTQILLPKGIGSSVQLYQVMKAINVRVWDPDSFPLHAAVSLNVC